MKLNLGDNVIMELSVEEFTQLYGWRKAAQSSNKTPAKTKPAKHKKHKRGWRAKRWTLNDDLRLLKLKNDGVGYKHIAKMLGRSDKAVAVRMSAHKNGQIDMRKSKRK